MALAGTLGLIARSRSGDKRTASLSSIKPYPLKKPARVLPTMIEPLVVYTTTKHAYISFRIVKNL